MIRSSMKIVISTSNQTNTTKKKRKNLDQLIREREEIVKEVVKPLASKPNELYVEREQSTSLYIISIRDKVKYPGGYRSHRFNTIAPGLVAGYFEMWRRAIEEKENAPNEYFYLDRAYLHFYLPKKKENTEEEFFLLHCDPNDDGQHAIYKQSLHLHIECHDAPSPHCNVWPRSHIALNVGMQDQILASVESLTEALRAAVSMLKNQVLENDYWQSIGK
ncbi:hypothetical protein [Trichocoleus sp. FACHB-262]|uniref:hypothetical protein n=1 Tax=Trichocoleus sp. FACHB-262 TaxID=2692869 RepID=UPI001684BA10|nr:hypothetical protein [Trichocoleus sp. FACHB-262]MBD2122404.1 hypothetical protein [Trichocoleus sp. FACHB-262]